MAWMLSLLVSIFLWALIAFYFYLKKCNSFWKERGVTTVKTNYFLGISYDYLMGRVSLEKMYENIYEANPNEPYVGVYNVLEPVLFLRDPELFHQITVRDFSHFRARQHTSDISSILMKNLAFLEGKDWKTMRQKLLPTFTNNKLKRMCVLVEECADLLIQHRFK